MKKPIELLSASERALLDRSIAWHVRAHREAFLSGLASISPTLRFDGMSVVELGALARSSLSTFLVGRGATATVTCYPESEVAHLDSELTRICAEHGLARDKFKVQFANMLDLQLPEKYDIALCKGVLGAVNRQHDQTAFRTAVANCISFLKPGGHLLIVEKAHSLEIIHSILKKYGGAGKNNYHYFTFEETQQLVPPGARQTHYDGYGVMSFGHFGKLQKVADFLDQALMEWVVPPKKRAVFSTVITRD